MSAENTKFTCPDCAGAIERITEGPVQYRCRVGHLYSPLSALATHRDRQENTLWSAVVLLEEGAELAEEVLRLSHVPDSERALLEEEVRVKRRLAQQIKAVVHQLPKRASLDEG
jgi:hypothetical protein